MGNTSIVDQDVNPPEVAANRRGQRPDLPGIADVALRRQQAASLTLRFPARQSERRGAARGEDQVATFRCQGRAMANPIPRLAPVTSAT
jgi:hypothetical protein